MAREGRERGRGREGEGEERRGRGRREGRRRGRGKKLTMSTSEHLRVVVRVRPLEKQSESLWRVEGNTISLCSNAVEAGTTRESGGEEFSSSSNSNLCNATKFSVDTVLGSELSTQHLYTQSVKDVIESTLEGINGTVFAYGQVRHTHTHQQQQQQQLLSHLFHNSVTV